jgi:hypothetical protein
MWQRSLEKRLVIQEIEEGEEEEEEDKSVLYVGRWKEGKYHHCVTEEVEDNLC